MHPIVILMAGFLVVFVGGGTRFAIGLTLKPMVAELGWTRGELGLAVGFYFVVSAAAIVTLLTVARVAPLVNVCVP